jgi:hypothetical protein
VISDCVTGCPQCGYRPSLTGASVGYSFETRGIVDAAKDAFNTACSTSDASKAVSSVEIISACLDSAREIVYNIASISDAAPYDKRRDTDIDAIRSALTLANMAVDEISYYQRKAGYVLEQRKHVKSS